MSELFDVYDLAKRYRVSFWTIHRWRRQKKLPAPDVVRGAKVFWTRALIEADEQRSPGR